MVEKQEQKKEEHPKENQGNTLQKGDFIEVMFTGKTLEGQIFDSNREADLKKVGKEANEKAKKPFIFALGEGMLLKGIDDYLIGKPTPKQNNTKEYNIEIKPEDAFGKREQKNIQRMPLNIFKQHGVNPQQGAVYNFDNKPGKILSVTGGRVMVDFNHPLAGKPVVYNVQVKRKVTDLDEKVRAFIDFVFKRELNYEIDKENKKIKLKVEPQIKQMTEMFKQKFKDLFNLDLEVHEKSQEKPEEEKQNDKNTETKDNN
ncbi:MAG TPA: FKBP-type peptidyl-prolyl cis-trans isomerase [Candidatus Nanoarchaeia archaeon]|nr:FKBP-type peptidyl-prolyl cis-trans isomerase [Candidatus Nanoarchaeia archaeon]